MSRFRAFSIHFGISLAIFAVLAWVVVRVWYPDLFFATDGGWEGIRIIVYVDLVLGPLLTLIVFKAGKPGLKFDLSMIGLAQAVALAGGVYVVHTERPLAMVYVDGHFFSVSRDDFREEEIEIPEFDTFPGPYPKWIAVALPPDPVEQSDLRSQMLKAGTPLRLMTDHYVAFAPGPTFTTEAQAVADVEARDLDHTVLPQWFGDHGGALADYRFYPYGARYKYVLLGFRLDSTRPVGLLDFASPYAPDGAG